MDILILNIKVNVKNNKEIMNQNGIIFIIFKLAHGFKIIN